MRRFAGLVGLAGAFVLVAACTEHEPEEITPEQERRVAEIGEAASQDLISTLVSHLTAAMGEGGPVYAIDFCSTRALGLTDDAAEAAGHGLELKRTSFRYRNPSNAPDEAEAEALEYFQATLAETGQLPSMLVQRGGSSGYRYYRPLTVAPPCLNCHGAEDQLAPEVRERLGELYPGDRATGYEVGDFRGVIRVSIPADRITG